MCINGKSCVVGVVKKKKDRVAVFFFFQGSLSISGGPDAAWLRIIHAYSGAGEEIRP